MEQTGKDNRKEPDRYFTLEQSIQYAMTQNHIIHYQKEADYYTLNIEELCVLFISVQKSENGYLMDDVVVYREHGNSIETQVIFDDEQQREMKVHRHDFYEVIYVMYGKISQNILGNNICLNENDVLILNQNILHKELFVDDAAIVYIDCPVQKMEEILEECGLRINELFTGQGGKEIRKEYIYFAPKQTRAARAIIDQLLEEQSRSTVGRRWMTMGMTARLMGTLFNKEEYTSSLFSEELKGNIKTFKEIERYLEHCNWNVKKGELKKQFYYNEAYLSHILKKYTGMSLTNYCIEHKLSKAEYLLRHTDVSINEIVSRLGYQNKSYFYRKFRQKYGITPQELRKNIQNGHL